MSIEREHKLYILYCDVCGIIGDYFYEFESAVNYKKQNGWKSQKHKGQWEDVCPGCQESEGGEGWHCTEKSQ